MVRNGYFGDASKFELYEQSQIKRAIMDRGGLTLFLPDLADRVTDALYTDRITFAEAQGQLKLGDRAVLQSWRNAVHSMLVEAEL